MNPIGQSVMSRGANQINNIWHITLTNVANVLVIWIFFQQLFNWIDNYVPHTAILKIVYWMIYLIVLFYVEQQYAIRVLRLDCKLRNLYSLFELTFMEWIIPNFIFGSAICIFSFILRIHIKFSWEIPIGLTELLCKTFIEEYVFRGIIFNWMKKELSQKYAIMGCSLLFAFFHLFDCRECTFFYMILTFISAFLFSVLLCFTICNLDYLGRVIRIHLLWNAFIFGGQVCFEETIHTNGSLFGIIIKCISVILFLLLFLYYHRSEIKKKYDIWNL